MKNLTQFLLVLLCVCLPATVFADQNKDKDDDSKYLAGAVPEVDGKVVFTKEFSIPGMSQEEIFKRMQNWMEARLKKNENTSRVVYTNLEEGQIVGTGDEWIVFSSSALSLDRTKILYQISVVCAPEKCTMEVEKIRYNYREGKEKYTAEEWIVDKYALNKAKTKLVRGLAKWRRKTVDFVDDLATGAAEALSASTAKKATEAVQAEEKKEEKSVINSGPIVIAPKTAVEVKAPAETTKTTVIPATPLTPATPAASNAVSGYKEVAPDQLPTNAIQMGAGKLVLVIGSDAFNMTMMTANAGGSLGKSSGKPVIFSFLSPDQPYEQMEKAETYTVRFYPANQTEPSVVLECKKMPSQAPMDGQPRMYVGEIVKAFVK
ncbi:DUF4468 domain-containing protein [Bacteroides oleiciplenus]|uniref:DUF4468 domain-containing protein n=2 Tax=Bacteroides oleiciplenus TaxID=626931 RepID=K9EDV0_9BACE|nr:DUF4468 domain-containing protein [Bacteroides oleiciplenus]EKU89137.1 hypothetical protein HMPREF9447_03462 [Bacteroides oleiciplenus YIT 12058]RGN38359.1 DUF4468 domain-containing protein [Bacteroides oleiciplenus]